MEVIQKGEQPQLNEEMPQMTDFSIVAMFDTEDKNTPMSHTAPKHASAPKSESTV